MRDFRILHESFQIFGYGSDLDYFSHFWILKYFRNTRKTPKISYWIFEVEYCVASILGTWIGLISEYTRIKNLEDLQENRECDFHIFSIFAICLTPMIASRPSLQ